MPCDPSNPGGTSSWIIKYILISLVWSQGLSLQFSNLILSILPLNRPPLRREAFVTFLKIVWISHDCVAENQVTDISVIYSPHITTDLMLIFGFYLVGCSTNTMRLLRFEEWSWTWKASMSLGGTSSSLCPQYPKLCTKYQCLMFDNRKYHGWWWSLIWIPQTKKVDFLNQWVYFLEYIYKSSLGLYLKNADDPN